MPRRYRMRRRAEAVEETRRRIVAATAQLHAERGIAATSWDEIADRAGVSLATVYRHFPSLDQLIPACGALTSEQAHPPGPADAPRIFGRAAGPARRFERLVGELCRFYARADVPLRRARGERALHPALGEWLDDRDADRLALVRLALGESAPAEAARAAAAAIADPVWRSFLEHGFTGPAAERHLVALGLAAAGLPAPTARRAAPPP